MITAGTGGRWRKRLCNARAAASDLLIYDQAGARVAESYVPAELVDYATTGSSTGA